MKAPYSRYYRHTLSPDEKKVYDCIAKGFAAVQDKIDLPSGTEYRTVQDKVMPAIKYDYPVFFYVDFGGWCFYTLGTQRYITAGYYMKGRELRRAVAEIDHAAEDYPACVSGMTPYQKALYIHDWLVKRCIYETNPHRPYDAHNIYGPFRDRACVCEGYALAYKYLCDLCGIECFVVLGEGVHPDGTSGSHAWNMIRIDGKTYHVDVTFDHLLDRTFVSRAFFGLCTKDILTDHRIDRDFPVPDCPQECNPLRKVHGTRELMDFLRDESKRGVRHTEVRFSVVLQWTELEAMMKRRATLKDAFWLSRVDSYYVREKTRTFVVCWKK